MPADIGWRRFAAVSALGLGAALLLGRLAVPPPASYFSADQHYYLSMADPQEHAADSRMPPFCWRIVPAALVRASGLPADLGFHVLTLVTLTLIPAVTAAFLLAAGVSARSAFLMAAAAAVAPAVTGYLSWDYILLDGSSLLLVVLSAWAIVSGRRAVFVAALAVLSLTKETWLVAAAFALVWTWFDKKGLWKWAVAGSALALVLAVTVRLLTPTSAPYSVVAIVHGLYSPPTVRLVARRLLLATSATWTVLAPVAAFALARRIREPRSWAVGLAILTATGQVLVAIDTQRVVAVAYPFVLLACAWALDRLTPSRRTLAGLLLVLGQLPWLVTYARVWPLQLRAVEIALVALGAAGIAYGLTIAFTAGAASRCADPSVPCAE